MVGPMAEEERHAANRRLGAVFVAFVGLSTGMTAFYGGATPVEVGVVGIVGVAAGAAMLVAIGAWPSR